MSDLQCFDARLETFEGWTQKRKKTYTAAVARRGWFITALPSTCKCISCDVVRDSWDGKDDPCEGHKPSCRVNAVWAKLKRDKKGLDALEERCNTFEDGWPYDKTTSLGAEKMAEAGFIYFPLNESNDTAFCVYCDLSLDGWEGDDDPIHEHRKRKPKCSYLQARDKSLSRQAIADSKSSRAAAARIPKKAPMGTRRKQAASQKGEPDLGSPEQMAATEPPEHIPSTRESSPPTSPTLSIAASERRSREHSLAPSEEIVLDSHVPNKPKNAPVAGKRRRPVREAVAPDNAQSLERDVAEISEADDPPPVRKRIRKVQSKKNNSTTSASDHPAPSVVSALSPSPIPPQKLAPSPPPRSQPQTNDRQSDAENNPSPPPAPTGRPRRDRAKNVNYSEDLLDADGKPKQARKLLKSQTISKDVPEESGRGKNVEPRTKRVEAEIVTHAVPPPAPKQSRKTRPRKKVQEEKASLEQISASESEAPTTAPPSPSIAASDTEVASPPTEPSNSRSPPPATIFGVPNQPGFYPHIRIKPLEAKLQSYELSEQELKMTVTEYLMEEAKTIQAQFIHRREKAFERVTEEYEKLVGWIEQQPTE